jgi:predicted enzyme related to lactoylglutathione lyase
MYLPYPYGREVTGYQVTDLDKTLMKAQGSGATVLSRPQAAAGCRSAVLQFPGGYIAEVHAQTSH